MYHFYLDPAQHESAAILVDRETGALLLIDRDRQRPGLFHIQDVNPADKDKVTAAIQREYGERERGGNPDHDCTGRPFRGPAYVHSCTGRVTGLVHFSFRPSVWEFDI
jgi:hypothetical protein